MLFFNRNLFLQFVFHLLISLGVRGDGFQGGVRPRVVSTFQESVGGHFDPVVYRYRTKLGQLVFRYPDPTVVVDH